MRVLRSLLIGLTCGAIFLSWGAVAVHAWGAVAAHASSAQRGLHVIPFPGTPDASPSSRVIFSSLRPSDLRSVVVIGSHSGPHSGRLIALPDGAGAAFVPIHGFSAGELVRVSARLSTPQAGTASGAPRTTHLGFDFRVAVTSSPATMIGRVLAEVLSEPRPQDAKAQGGPTRHFRSEPALTPPVITVDEDRDPGAGEIFLTAQNSAQVGPMIVNARGQLVWFDPLKGAAPKYYAANLAVQRYQGHPVLTWWQGVGLREGEDVIMNRSYRRVAVVRAGNGYQADVHEFQITPDATALLSVVTQAHADLTGVGGPPDGPVLTNVIQEVDIKTGQVLWEWHSLGHVPVNASYEIYSPKQPAYDYFHLNSIQQLPSGNLLISARNTWALYEISRQTGRVIWTLGGKYSDFKMGPGAGFGWQHDARLHTDGILSLFNDASNFNTQPQASQSSAKLLRINARTRTVSLVKEFMHSPPLLSGAAGSTQVLSNGDVFVGWGAQPYFSQYDPSGRQILDGRFALGVDSYRAFRFSWSGRPHTRPSLAAVPVANGHAKLYASWNGATQVKSWRVLGGETAGRLGRLSVRAARSGFETAIDAPDAPRYFAVQAVDGEGNVLGTSSPFSDPSHVALFGSRVFVPASGGYAALPVGCLSPRRCRLRVTVKTEGSALARSGWKTIPSDRGALVYVRLGPAATRRALVTVQSGREPSIRMTLIQIPYSAGGHDRPRALSESPGAHIAASTDYASSTGRAGLLTACYSSSPCHVTEVVSAGGRAIARTARPVLLGVDELQYVDVQLNQTGRRLLAGARYNRLTVQLRITNGARSETGRVDLVRYG